MLSYDAAVQGEEQVRLQVSGGVEQQQEMVGSEQLRKLEREYDINSVY